MATTTPLGLYLGTSHLCIPLWLFFQVMADPDPVLYCGVEWVGAGAFTQLGLGHMVRCLGGTWQLLSPPCHMASQGVRAPHERSPGFPSLLFFPEVFQPATGLVGPIRSPGMECWVCGLTRSLLMAAVHPCSLSFPLSPIPGAQVPTWSLFFLSYRITYGFFQQSWLCRSLSASFQLFFSETCSTCKCIFDVFVGGGELHVFLLCHLESPAFYSH